MRAADALMRIPPLGISHAVAETLFDDARTAPSRTSGAFNDVLFAELDVDRFFYSVRPYYKPYRVGRQEYRGANAGDFSGINEIDLLLGLCRGNDPYYSQLLVEKMLFMLPADQASLRDCMRRRSFLDQFLDALDESREHGVVPAATPPHSSASATEHGRVAAQHHDQLVARFIEAPSKALDESRLEQVTASGPPLPVLLVGSRGAARPSPGRASRRHRVALRRRRAPRGGRRQYPRSSYRAEYVIQSTSVERSDARPLAREPDGNHALT